MDQYHQEAVPQNDSIYEDVASLGKWNSLSSMLDGSENTQSGGFDCNICLDSVQDPVITLCGHLYCWPCIYKWIHFQSVSTENFEKQNPQCPVCKAEVSQKTLVPLYGRGKTTNHYEGKAPQLGIVIPNRPPSPTCSFRALVTNSTTTTSSRPGQQVHQRSYTQQPQMYNPQSLSGTTRTNAYDPIIGMFGEMVYTRIFGNSETTLYTYPNSYNLAGSNSPRVRRHVMQADRSLGRICFFLCCCIVLCLLLF